MKKLISVLILGMAIIAAPVFAASHTLEEQVNSALQAFVAALNRSDATAIGNLYAADATMIPPGGVIAGRAAITAFYQTMFDENGAEKSEAITDRIEVHGDVAILVGRFRTGDKDGKMLSLGNMVIVYKQSGADWLIHLEMWNFNE